MFNLNNIIASSVSLIAIIVACQAEYFSSIDGLSKLDDVEAKLIQISREYMKLQEQEYASYLRFIEHVKLQHDVAARNEEDYVGNPINAFTLIKRLVTDWNNLHKLLSASPARSEFESKIKELEEQAEVPNNNDLVGAIKGLNRLQNFYDIPAAVFADGRINGVDHGSSLNWHDCYEIAVNLYDLHFYNTSIEWFDLSLVKLNRTGTVSEARLANIEVDIYEYLAMAYFELGKVDIALSYIDGILEVMPENSVKDTKIYMLHNAARQQAALPPFEFPWQSNYTRLCQGKRVPDSKQNRLKCYLDHRPHVMFRLAPLKVEELYLDPDITMYHQMLNDKQIQEILSEAALQMQRSSVVDGTGGIVSDVRVSQHAWLTYQSKVMSYVRRLFEQLTGYDFNNVELMQMANYGIGGQYDAHYDFFMTDFKHKTFIGNRIATAMFYLSNVEQGGYTVFPFLNTYLVPVQGSLVLWHNLHKSLDEDYRTLHAGCPVLKGSKRIGNIWTHTDLQEFARPCALQNDKIKSLGFQ